MRLFISLILAVALLSNCSRHSAVPSQTSDVVDAAEAEALEPEESKQPPAIRKLFDAWLASLPADRKPLDADAVRSEFVRSFFSGFTTHMGTVGLRSEAEKEGFKAGQECRLSNPGQAKGIFESYGYVETKAEGIWTVRFEHSGFKFADSGDGKEWWFSTLADTDSDLPVGGSIPESGVSIRVIGWLSPQGNHGHFGAYERAFFATKISKSEGQ
jgi:hypothetical protein